MKRYELSTTQWRRMEGFLPRACRLGGSYGQVQPEFRERNSLGSAQRGAVKGPTLRVRELEKRPQAFHPLDQGLESGRKYSECCWRT